MPEQIRVVAFVEARAGQEAAIQAAAQACIAPTRQEPGCLEYTFNRDDANPARFVFMETWASKAALDAHMRTAHLQAFMKAAQDSAQGDVTVHLLHPVA